MKFTPIKATAMADREIYAFLITWYEDHRAAKLSELKKLYLIAPYRGIAYRRTSDRKLKPGTSWSKDLTALDTHYQVKGDLYKANILGIDVESLVNMVIHLDPKNQDLHELKDVLEVIAIQVTNPVLIPETKSKSKARPVSSSFRIGRQEETVPTDLPTMELDLISDDKDETDEEDSAFVDSIHLHDASVDTSKSKPTAKVVSTIAEISRLVKALTIKAGYDDVPVLQHNFNDHLRQGTGDAEDMDLDLDLDTDLESEAEFALTFPNTDGRPDQNEEPIDINLGAEDIYQVQDFKSSAPYFAYSKHKTK